MDTMKIGEKVETSGILPFITEDDVYSQQGYILSFNPQKAFSLEVIFCGKILELVSDNVKRVPTRPTS